MKSDGNRRNLDHLHSRAGVGEDDVTETAQETGAQLGGTVHAFLIADVRGYTRFTVDHGDEAAARLAAQFAALVREIVSAHEGAVIELRGDEALAVFSSARQAIRAAVDLQEHIAPETMAGTALPLRVGVGLDAGEAIPVEGGFRGAALNLAARLCALAGPGEVLASESVIHLARKLEGLRYAERGAVALKGFADPVRVAQIVAEEVERAEIDIPDKATTRERPLPIGGFLGALPAGPLVAREAELQTVSAAVDAGAAGSGRLLFLTGEPGVGKTRLAQEITLNLRNRAFLVATGRCYEPQEAVPFYPWLEALGTLYASAPPTVRSALPQRWPYLGRLLPNENLPVPTGSVEGGEEQERLFWAVTGFLRTLAEAQPVALLLDDLQWADETSLALLQHLARQTRADAVLLLGTYRDVEAGRKQRLRVALRDLNREKLAERVPVRRLDKEATAALIATTFDQETVSDEFSELVYRHTEGNAYFTQEVLMALVERGDISREDGHWERREIGELVVPESIRAAIEERLGHLGEESRNLLYEASVLGQTFMFDELRAMPDHSEDEVEESLDECVAAGLLRETGDDAYSFHHALTQQTLYGELSARRRRKLHLAAGEALEGLLRDPAQRAAELARHFLKGDNTERALRYAGLAGDQAEAVFAHDDAERQYRTALQLARDLGDDRIEGDLSAKLGKTLHRMGRYEEALQVLQRAAEISGSKNDIETEASVAALIGRLHSDRGTPDEGIAVVKRVLDRMDGRTPSLGVAQLYVALSFLYFAAGQYREQQLAAERASDLARQLGNDEMLAAAESRRGTALLMLGQVERGYAVLEEALPLIEQIGDLVSLQRALSALAHSSWAAGHFDRARKYRERALENAELLGTPGPIAFARATLGRVYFYQGEWSAAGTLLERAVAAAGTTDAWHTAYPLVHLGELRLAQGAWDDAARLLEAGAAVSRRGKDMQGLRMAHHSLAELDILRGEPGSARERLQPLLDRPGLTEDQVTPMLPILAWAELKLGNGECAERLLEETLNRARAQHANLAIVDALRVRGVLRTGQRRWTEAERDFEQSATMARDMNYPYAEARSFYERGLMHREQGEPERSQEYLERALAVFQRLGAEAYTSPITEAIAEVS